MGFYDLAIEKQGIWQNSEPYPRGKSIQLTHVTITQARQALVGDQLQEGQGSQAWACIILIIQVPLCSNQLLSRS
mgnify:CR=1 FL=1